MQTPKRELQERFWDDWNTQWRLGHVDDFMKLQEDIALRHARGKILEVGCGTGWLSNALSRNGEVTALDLSPQAIVTARARYPQVHFIAGDFATAVLGGPFDSIVSVECIGHVADQQAFIDRIWALLKPGGVFVLLSQNPFVWNRSSNLMKQGEGQIRNWPSLAMIRQHFAGRFAIEEISGMAPGGDRGILWLAHKNVIRGAVRMLLGRARRDRLYLRYTGRDMVIVARKK